MILPLADPKRPALLQVIVRSAAAAIAVMIIGFLALLRTPELTAEASELSLLPGMPTRGTVVTVEYRATTRFATLDHLALRARYYTEAGALAPERVAVLERNGDSFAGSFRLPEEVDYVVFAVESLAGDNVDYNPEQWDLLVYSGAGVPLLRALHHQAEHRSEWSTDRWLGTAAVMVDFYPDSVQSWTTLLYAQLDQLGADEREDAAASHLERLQAFHARDRARSLDLHTVQSMYFYASAVGDSTIARSWRDRLVADYPTHPTAVAVRVREIIDSAADPRELLARLDLLWQEHPQAGAVGMTLTAFMAAVRLGDVELLRRWGSRLTQTSLVVGEFMKYPELRFDALERAREQIARLDAANPRDRPLHLAIADLRRDYQKGLALGMLGRLLMADGRLDAALDTLRQAASTTWDPNTFRALAEIQLELGDTLQAAATLGLVAADPETSPLFPDSVRARFPAAFQIDLWEGAVREGERQMRTFFLRRSLDRRLRGPILLSDLDGGEIEFTPGESPQVVMFWSRFCNPSLAQLDEFQRVFETLRSRGVRVIAITRESASPELSAFLAERGYTFPVYSDLHGSARVALDNAATPRYFVIDSAGIRFERGIPRDLVREAQVAGMRSDR